MQQIITYFIIAGAVGYVCWNVFQSFRKKPDACEEKSPGCKGCQLKDGCKITSAKYQ